MCLTTEAFLLFLSILPSTIVETSSDRIVIHAEVRDAVWEVKEDKWCTPAPQIDAAVRLKGGADT
ncbi:ketol-acid reductoisomerase [Tropicimonas marinistellae]|uniref:ketol-acid reductoisomerase n=1 Tax=Tropicimonas marinistellae TaxID=1739787 RepID=UPI0008326E76|nr:ketol-acid reductoisomerase [Tropicimonas marinistellae]